MNDIANLDEQAALFAQRLENLMTSVVGPTENSYTTVTSGLQRKSTEAILIQQNNQKGIALSVEGKPLLRLSYKFRCTCDNPATELQVEESNIALRTESSAEPLLHYDYVRNIRGNIPAAHINVHASNDAATKAMLACGFKAQGRNRRQDFIKRGIFPTFSSLHLPVGGDRMRPGLEDVLQLAVYEFGIDVEDGWQDAIEASREEYRKIQLRAFVREFPDIAFEELRQAGYVKGEHVPERPTREGRVSRLIRY